MNEFILSPEQEQSLASLWQKTTSKDYSNTGLQEADLQHVYNLGLGMQETLEFLFRRQPDFPVFLQWIKAHGSQPTGMAQSQPDILDDADLQHWQTNGYVILRNAISPEECAAANLAIWDFLGADPANPDSWYQPHEAKNGLMVIFTQHPALQAIRNSTRIRKAYEQLYGTTNIYKIVDKVSFNPPETSYYTFAGSPLHWDTSLELPVPDRYQGLLYLTDVTAEGGAFQCVPGFHRSIDEWVKGLPAGTDLRKHALETLQPVAVAGNAGDFIIWHQALPHCASPNKDNYPRLVQYLTYLPVGFEDKRSWM